MSLYNVNKLFSAENLVKLEYHGIDTRVLFEGEGEKRDVKAGDVVEVSTKQAKQLLAYSRDWTLKGDKPVEHEFDKAQARLREQMNKDAKKAQKERSGEKSEDESNDEDDEDFDVLLLNPEKMDKKEILAALKKMEVTANNRHSEEKLRGLLVESIQEWKDTQEAGKEVVE
jgi:hypothetical protein